MGASRHFWIALLLAGVAAIRPAFAEADLDLRSDSNLSTAGFYRLSWEGSDTPIQLLESEAPDFDGAVRIYGGSDTARLMSGKPDGDYYYRLEATGPGSNGPAEIRSNVVKVTVRHHELARAFLFFAIGAVIFLATLALILLGDRGERAR